MKQIKPKTIPARCGNCGGTIPPYSESGWYCCGDCKREHFQKSMRTNFKPIDPEDVK